MTSRGSKKLHNMVYVMSPLLAEGQNLDVSPSVSNRTGDDY
jgi:hypothetical protein